MFFIIDKPRFEKMLRIARPVRKVTKHSRPLTGPFLRVEAKGKKVCLSSKQVSAEFGATVLEPGVLFMREQLFVRLLHSIRGEKELSIQVTGDSLLFSDVRMPLESNEMLLYPDVERAPKLHPKERSDEAEKREKELLEARENVERLTRELTEAREHLSELTPDEPQSLFG